MMTVTIKLDINDNEGGGVIMDMTMMMTVIHMMIKKLSYDNNFKVL